MTDQHGFPAIIFALYVCNEEQKFISIRDKVIAVFMFSCVFCLPITTLGELVKLHKITCDANIGKEIQEFLSNENNVHFLQQYFL